MAPRSAVDAVDPEGIRDALPEGERERFLEEYRQAAELAARDMARYRELRWLLHTWQLRAAARADPDFERRRQEAAHPPPGAFLSASRVMPELEHRLEGRG